MPRRPPLSRRGAGVARRCPACDRSAVVSSANAVVSRVRSGHGELVAAAADAVATPRPGPPAQASGGGWRGPRTRPARCAPATARSPRPGSRPGVGADRRRPPQPAPWRIARHDPLPLSRGRGYIRLRSDEPLHDAPVHAVQRSGSFLSAGGLNRRWVAMPVRRLAAPGAYRQEGETLPRQGRMDTTRRRAVHARRDVT